MDIAEFKANLKSGNLKGWYVFCGEEDYLKKHYMKELRAAASGDDAFALFNYVSFDGSNIDFGSLAEAIKSPPMMSEYKLIEWKFAPIDDLKESELCALEALFSLKEEYPYAIFAIMTTADRFDVGTLKRPSRKATRLAAAFDILNFSKSTDSQLHFWLKKHFDAEGVRADAPALNTLIFRSGHSMEVLNNEVLKLCAYAKANGLCAVTPKEVEEVAAPTVESDAFALSNAVLDKNVVGAFVALSDLKQRRVDPQIIISMLERTYSELSSVALLLEEGCGAAVIETTLKFHPFKAKLYINAVRKVGAKRLAATLTELCRIDASSKSGGISGYDAIEMFITQNL